MFPAQITKPRNQSPLNISLMGSSRKSTQQKTNTKPLGIQFIEHIKGSHISHSTYQAIALAVTFFAYLFYHTTRKTTSIVKTALDPQSPAAHSNPTVPGWTPFNGPDGTKLLSSLDVSFLFTYAIGMYFSGHVGDRTDLRVFLTLGMFGTGFFTAMFGFGYWEDIHNFYYYLVIQMSAGLFQSTGWPSVVAVVGNWFAKKKRGLIMGVWNSHTSLGNIIGSLVSSVLLKNGWGWSMVVPGLGISFVGIVLFFLLPVSPKSVGAVIEDETRTEPLLESNKSGEKDGAVGFMVAWSTPGVVPFAMCLFFAKLVAYTFLYWLRFYISHTAIEGKYLTNEESGSLSTMFDVGGVIGGILASHISDRSEARATTAASFMLFSIPSLFLYRTYGHISTAVNIMLTLVAGVFVNGPYALITTAVSADLGTHSSLKGNSRALATVTAIIDGTGSDGAAIRPLLTGYISTESWNAVFGMLMISALIAGLLLTRLVIEEVREKMWGLGTEAVSRSRLG